MKIAVLSDTHIPTKAKKLPEILLRELEQVDSIIHAGDLVSVEVLEQLQSLAPVHAVCGNVDNEKIKRMLPEKLKLKLNGFKIGVTHGHLVRGNMLDRLSYIFPEEDLIIFGHTHKPVNQKIGQQVFFNPGSPTDRRLQPEHSFGIIYLEEDIRIQLIKF